MSPLITEYARAYVNHGRWIAECPRDCGGAMQLEPKQAGYACGECQHMCSVEWPADADGIWAALMERSIPRTRNWFPAGHVLALKCGAPTGQTPSDLREEQKENDG
jgi:hypothetical protein